MRSILTFGVLFAIASAPGCSCDNPNRHGPSGGDMAGGTGPLSISPSEVTLDLDAASVPPSQMFTVTYHGAKGDQDVSGQALFTLADPTLGTMLGADFTSGPDHGGTTTLLAQYDMQTAQATIHVRVHGSFSTSDCSSGCMLPPDNSPSCGGADTQPTVVYPPDGVLLPPNMEQMDVHWTPGTGNTLFEVDLSNSNTDVKIATKCVPTVDTRGMMSGGCKLALTTQMWDFVAKSNKGGDPVKVSVRGSNGTCLAPGTNSVGILFAEQDVSGAIYYWKSTVSTSGTGGQVWRKEFGDTMAEESITGGAVGGTCNGCHTLSRDGKFMIINADDDDSDDEYGDTTSGLVDVAKKMLIGTGQFGSYPCGPAGFQAFNHDHSVYLASTGDGSGSPGWCSGGTPTSIMGNQFFLYQPVYDPMTMMTTIMQLNPVTCATTGKRCTQPDWSLDDRKVVYVIPSQAGSPNWQADDDHLLQGSLWTLDYDPASKSFSAPQMLLQSQGENNYYPSYSPDGAFVVFNRVALQAGPDFPNNDSFSNPKAKVFVLPTGQGATPVECTALNGTGDVSNSWPRWSPFIQTYKGNKLLWVTFSSTRDYGLVVRNSSTGLVQCYPPDSAEDPGGSHGQPFPSNCVQPQIWMAAVNLTSAEVMNTTDPSFPAFWLPFQDVTTHNHTAQWTTTVVQSPPDGGACIMGGEDCTKNPNGCCSDAPICTANGTCGNL